MVRAYFTAGAMLVGVLLALREPSTSSSEEAAIDGSGWGGRWSKRGDARGGAEGGIPAYPIPALWRARRGDEVYSKVNFIWNSLFFIAFLSEHTPLHIHIFQLDREKLYAAFSQPFASSLRIYATVFVHCSLLSFRSFHVHCDAIEMPCSLHDEIVEIQVEVQKLFIECGNKYYAENEMELQKIELLECEQLPRRPAITRAIATTTSTTTTTLPEPAAAAATAPKPPPSPPMRPSLGCRAIVQRSLRMIDIVARELSDWKEAVRLHSLRLLWQIVRHAEKAFTSKLAAVLPALCKCAQDDEASVVREAERVAIVMGELLDVDDWLPGALEAVQKSPNHVGTMRCFGHLFGGAGWDAKRPHIARIAAAMDAAELGYSVRSAYQAATLDVLVQLVDIYSSRRDPSADGVNEMHAAEEHLFGVAAKTAASSYAHNVHGISERATAVFAQFCGAPANRRALQAKYGAHVIAADQDLEPEYADDSAYVVRVCGYVLLFGFQPEIHGTLGESIQAVLQKGSADAKVKMLAAMATVTYTQSNGHLCPVFTSETARAGSTFRRFCSGTTQMPISTTLSATLSATFCGRSWCGGRAAKPNRSEQWPHRLCARSAIAVRRKWRSCFRRWWHSYWL